MSKYSWKCIKLQLGSVPIYWQIIRTRTLPNLFGTDFCQQFFKLNSIKLLSNQLVLEEYTLQAQGEYLVDPIYNYNYQQGSDLYANEYSSTIHLEIQNTYDLHMSTFRNVSILWLIFFHIFAYLYIPRQLHKCCIIYNYNNNNHYNSIFIKQS